MRQGTPPDMVQLGNEINPGMLWDYAATWTGCSTADEGYPGGATKTVCHTENWDDLAELLTAGYRAVKAVSPRTRVMLHLAEGGDNGTFRWWFDNVTSRDVPFDVIGASYYGYWHGTLAELQANLDDITARYGKDVVVVETAYAFTLDDDDGWANIIGTRGRALVPGYPGDPGGPGRPLRDVMNVVRAVPGGRGLGVFYWEATWTAVPGNGWTPRDPASGQRLGEPGAVRIRRPAAAGGARTARMNALRAGVARMRAEGLPEPAIRGFASRFRRFAAGELGLLPDDALQPVSDVVDAARLPRADRLERTVIVKLNGGLGTSMGLRGPKSLIEAKDGQTFLDVIARQCLRARHGVRLPLVLMNSFRTRDVSWPRSRATRLATFAASSSTIEPSCAPTTSRRCAGRATRRSSGARPATATSTPP